MDVFLLFIIGSVIGSFLGVVIDRIAKGQSIIFPPSHCTHCKHQLVWYDLIPVVSYLLIGGKCRYCKKKISAFYPFIELITASLFALAYMFAITSGIVYTIYLLVMVSVFIIIFFSDYKYGIIPVYTIVVGLAAVLLYLIYAHSLQMFLVHITSALGAFLFFFFLFAITKGRGMGFGDVMLVLLLGFFLGFPHTPLAIYLSFLSGAIVSLLLIFIGEKKVKHDTIPFGPFLILGTLSTVIWGNAIITWFMGYLWLS